MRIIRFEAETGQELDEFGSVNARLARIAQLTRSTQIACIKIGPGGRVGFHPADGPQFFLVIAGSGWVRGEDSNRIPIHSGEAAFWTYGEGHESGSDSGMTAVVIEGETARLFSNQ